MNNKLKISFQKKRNSNEIDNKNQLLEIKVKDKDNRLKKIYMHGYLVGLELANLERQKNKNHSIILCIGGVGTGKSTLIKGMAGVNATLRGDSFSLDNVAWTTNVFCSLYHNVEMYKKGLVFDESIDGIGRLNSSNKGEKLKKTIITGRFQLHTSYLLVDELQEFHPKLSRMADVLIRVLSFGTKRGYFEVYTDKRKIKFIYNGLKYFGKTWSSPEIKRILPDCKGRFPDYSNIFFDEKEFDAMKLEQTKEDDTEDNKSLNKRESLILGHLLNGSTPQETMAFTNSSDAYVYKTRSKFTKLITKEI